MSRTITGVRVVAMLPMTDQMKSANGLVRIEKGTKGRIFATRENQHGLECFWVEWVVVVDHIHCVQLHTSHSPEDGRILFLSGSSDRK